LQELLSKFEVCDPLIYENDGRIFIALTFKTPEPIHFENFAIGIDLGIKLLAVTSEGKAIKGNEFNKHKRKIRYLKRKLQSKNTKSAKRHLKKIRRKERNFSNNYIHHVVNELLKTNANTIVSEDLSKIKRKKKKYENKNRISQIPFYKLRTILEYKALALGKKTVLVPPFYTSQIDYRGIKKGKRVGRRYYASDGKILDADFNASINIVNRFAKDKKLAISFVFPSDGSLKPNSQASVNAPIVGSVILVSDNHDYSFLQASMALA
jgi:IS605 OrfB family transposase